MMTDCPDLELIATIRAELAAVADPSKAPAMKKYMKSTMPYLGVPVPAVRAIVRHEVRRRKFTSTAQLAATATTMWRGAEYREYRYAATAMTDAQSARPLQSPQLLPLYQEMIVTGAWWDHVDDVAHRIGALLRGWPDQLQPVVLAWSTGEDRWLRRSSIICQVGAKAGVDRDLLTTTILSNAADPDFFLRKAIGWALRDYARAEPEWVRGFVAEHTDQLSPLSRREALKHLG
jgi:3-methyladenine DNA glycosylase AlkD